MAPMLMHDYFDDKGEITDDGIAFYEERAQGGFGLIYTGAFVALNEADNFNPGFGVAGGNQTTPASKRKCVRAAKA